MAKDKDKDDEVGSPAVEGVTGAVEGAGTGAAAGSAGGPTGTLIGGAVGLVGGLLDSTLGAKAKKRQRKRQREAEWNQGIGIGQQAGLNRAAQDLAWGARPDQQFKHELFSGDDMTAAADAYLDSNAAAVDGAHRYGANSANLGNPYAMGNPAIGGFLRDHQAWAEDMAKRDLAHSQAAVDQLAGAYDDASESQRDWMDADRQRQNDAYANYKGEVADQDASALLDTWANSHKKPKWAAAVIEMRREAGFSDAEIIAEMQESGHMDIDRIRGKHRGAVSGQRHTYNARNGG